MNSVLFSKNNNELNTKILITIFILIICRLGAFIPIAGINSSALVALAAQNQSGILGMFNMLSGGSLGRMSIFALAIMPYITASIVIQLMSIVYKPLESLKKEGEVGRRKVNQISRYLTVLLASFQAYGLANGLENIQTPLGSVVILPGVFFKITTVITLVVGTIFLMWLGEQITAYGIGNGSSLIIFVGIVSGIPNALISVFELARKGVLSPILLAGILIGILSLIGIIIFFERAQRKILIQYPKRQMGNKIYGGESSHIPLKLNTAGVIPPIFASALLLFPLTIANFTSNNSVILEWLAINLAHGKILYIIFDLFFIIAFSFLYTAVIFNSEETANNLRKSGAYITGRRPGSATADYLDYLLTRLTVIGSIYLSIICLIPELIMNKFALSFSLGGTSFLIIINVILDTFTQIQTYLFHNKYEKLIKKIKVK